MHSVVAFYIIFLLLLICPKLANSQQKYEKESRLKDKDIPVLAFNLIGKLEQTNKVKWYIEEGLEGKSIEAKFKQNKKEYSVEFDTTGNIQDIEIEIKWQDIELDLHKKIEASLGDICTKYKVYKTQIQYSGNLSDLTPILNGEENTKQSITKFELIAKCVSKDKKTEQFEYLFSNEGVLIKASQIIFKNSSNLEF